MVAAPPLYALLAALVVGAIALGGGIYETALIDRSWPRKPEIIQPERGGINRAMFWGPIHSVFELALLLALWLAWAAPQARLCIIAAVIIHFATRVWSFVYFIPLAMKFQDVDKASQLHEDKKYQWVRLSPWRVLLEAAVLLMLATAIVKLIG